MNSRIPVDSNVIPIYNTVKTNQMIPTPSLTKSFLKLSKNDQIGNLLYKCSGMFQALFLRRMFEVGGNI